MPPTLDETDRTFLRHALEVSRRALTDEGKTPFGAILVIDGQIVAEGTSSVIELRDPTAHAEVTSVLRSWGEGLAIEVIPKY